MKSLLIFSIWEKTLFSECVIPSGEITTTRHITNSKQELYSLWFSFGAIQFDYYVIEDKDVESAVFEITKNYNWCHAYEKLSWCRYISLFEINSSIFRVEVGLHISVWLVEQINPQIFTKFHIPNILYLGSKVQMYYFKWYSAREVVWRNVSLLHVDMSWFQIFVQHQPLRRERKKVDYTDPSTQLLLILSAEFGLRT